MPGACALVVSRPGQKIMVGDHRGEQSPLACSQFRPSTSPTEASDAIHALVDLFSDLRVHRNYRCYALEKIDGELVFTQTEADAAVEAAIETLSEPRPSLAFAVA
jgi:hypothetical protein